MSSPAFRRSLWAALLASVLVAGYLQIFTVFMLYDDEGYVLQSLNQFAQSGGLYHHVYSQYGPLFYLIFGGLARLGDFTWAHDVGRFVTLAHWIGTAALSGWIGLQLTRSHLVSAFTFVGTFAHLWQMSAEPMHPGGALALWIALGAGFSLKFLLAEQTRRFAITVGITAACCALVKINVGLFVAAAGGMWMWLNRTHRGSRGALFDGLLLVVAAIGPCVLMLRSIHETWAATYALVGGVAIASVAAWTIRFARPDFGLGLARSAIGTAAIVIGVTIAAIWVCGTSPTELIQGSLIGPLSHASIYQFPFNWRSGTIGGTLLSAITCAYALRPKPSARRTQDVLGGLRVLIMATVVLTSFYLPPRMLGWVMTSFGITLWWFVGSVGTQSYNLARGRCWLGLLAAWQFLHAYPVAGSQIGWGTFLWVPLGVSAVHASCVHWVDTRSIPSIWRSKLVPWGTAAIAAGIVIGQLRAGIIYFGLTAPLDLPGAQHLRVLPTQGSAIRIMSLPGAFSFNLWTGLDTPTGSNVTHWFSLLDETRQSEIETELRRRATPLIVQPAMVHTHLRSFIDPATPLFRYVEDNYETRIELNDLALWRQQSDPRPPINIAELYGAAASTAANEVTQIVSVRLTIPPSEQVAGVELAVFESDDSVSNFVALWHVGNTQVETKALGPDGQPATGATFEPGTWPLVSSGLRQFNFYPHEGLPEVTLDRIWLRFRNAAGKVVAEARFAKGLYLTRGAGAPPRRY